MENAVKQNERRHQMTLAAIELLEEYGPEAVTARKVTAKMGLSSMTIYTEFGSMANLVASIVDYGFRLLLQYLNRQPQTLNAIADLWGAACAARDFVLIHPHLNAVMFATRSVGGYERTGTELDQGIETLRFLHQFSRRAIESQNLTDCHPRQVTRQLWTIIHGHMMLELAGYLSRETNPLTSFANIFATTLIGFGVSPDVVNTAVSNLHHNSLTTKPTETAKT